MRLGNNDGHVALDAPPIGIYVGTRKIATVLTQT
jgi:hypothetical protein